jgi:hypothetical protein
LIKSNQIIQKISKINQKWKHNQTLPDLMHHNGTMWSQRLNLLMQLPVEEAGEMNPKIKSQSF